MKRVTAISRFAYLLFLNAAILLAATCVYGNGLDWPSGQLLPTFAVPVPMLDCVDLGQASGAENDLASSLEGLVNRTQPRLVCEERRSGEGKSTWIDLHGLKYQKLSLYDALLKYGTNASGLVVTDPDQPETLNVATTMAGVNDELICAPSLLRVLTNAPYNFRVADDLRGRFADKYAMYRFVLTNCWPRCTHRLFAGMNPNLHGHLRDYLVATKCATVWLGPGKEKDSDLLRSFFADIKPVQGVYIGWWPGEGDGLEYIAQYGVPVLASDFFCNASVYGGVTSAINVPPIPKPPRLENKVYVAMILSDGDNVQYMQHKMKLIWDKPVRGSIPIGWTVSPLAVQFDPAMLNYYWSTATTNDCLVSGPSGAGYAHINHWSEANMKMFAEVSAPYLQRSGLRVITIWDWVDNKVASAYATHCPDLLGLTDQRGTYSGMDSGLRTIKLTPTYTSTTNEMVSWISNAATKWNGKSPLFIAAQANVWNLGPDELVKVAAALDPAKYRLVRPDHLFMLANQAAAKDK